MRVTPMPIAELLHNARFLTNNLGVQTDVLIPIDTWQTLITLVNQIEVLRHDPEMSSRLSSSLEQSLSQLQNSTIPDREQWLWKNPDAIGAVQLGLAQAAQGKTKFLGSFAQYADLEIED